MGHVFVNISYGFTFTGSTGSAPAIAHVCFGNRRRGLCGALLFGRRHQHLGSFELCGNCRRIAIAKFEIDPETAQVYRKFERDNLNHDLWVHDDMLCMVIKISQSWYVRSLMGNPILTETFASYQEAIDAYYKEHPDGTN